MSDGRSGTAAPPAGPAPVRVFSEARLYRTPEGAVHAVDVSSGAAAWDVYVERIGAVELTARVGTADAVTGVPLGQIAVRALPFYSGPGELLRLLPRVVAAVLAATEGASVCVFRLPGTLGLVGAGWCRLKGRRYAVEVVGDPASVLRSGVLGPLGRLTAPAAAALTRWVVAGAAAGRYVTASTLQALYPLAPGVAEHHYSNVRLADADFTAGPRDARPVRRLLAVGSHDQLYKGHDDLIRAVALLAHRGVRVELGLVGDGRHHAGLRELAGSSGVGDRVRFHGRVNDRTELHRLLDEADLFCMPSRTEGLPRALIEAMARGVPAIGTDVGGIPELLDPSCCVPPSRPGDLADLIATYVAGRVDVAEASRVGWERARDFSLDRQAARVQGWLDEVVALARTSA